MRHINEIIVHCSATDPDWRKGQKTSTKVKEITRWHVEGNGWSDIGYHYCIDRDGTVALGRPIEKSGAHTKGHNANSIGICIFGGRTSSATDQFLDNYTPEQEAALDNLIGELAAKYPAISKVSGHNEYAAKACPGFIVGDWYAPKTTLPPTAPNWFSKLLEAIASFFRRADDV